MKLIQHDKTEETIKNSKLISRDLSWLKFNERVFDQIKKEKRNIFEKFKFLAIAASNLDEFFMIRVGSLYNYLDYDKVRIDYSGLREDDFKKKGKEVVAAIRGAAISRPCRCRKCIGADPCEEHYKSIDNPLNQRHGHHVSIGDMGDFVSENSIELFGVHLRFSVIACIPHP